MGFELSKHYVLAAGGTGGHMVPAAALAEELTRRGHRVALVSDARGVRFPACSRTSRRTSCPPAASR